MKYRLLEHDFLFLLGGNLMRKPIFVILILLVALFSVSLTSCRKKTLTPEESAAQKEIEKQWKSVLTAIEKQDIDGFMSLCSENVTKNQSRKSIEDFLVNSIKQMEGKARTDYEIAFCEFMKDGTEAKVTFKSRRKKDFIKENGKWLLKDI